MFETLLAFLGASAFLALSPGPDNLYVLAQSISNGQRAGLATTAGLIAGCIVHTSLIAFGISAVIAASPKIFWTIKILGAVYLLYLAFKVFQSDASVTLKEGAITKSGWALFKQGVIMNLLNPKVMIFFLAFFPAFIWEPEGNTVVQFYILGVLFMAISFLIFSSFAILAGSIAGYLRSHKNAGLVMKWLQIVVFVGIAVFIVM